MALILSEFEGNNGRTARCGSNCKEVSAISGAADVIQYSARSRIKLHVHNMHQRSGKIHKISMDLGYKTV